MRQNILRLLLATALLPVALSSTAQIITTIAGTPLTTGYTGDNGPATDATLFSPSDIVLDKIGNVYFTDFINNVIRKIDTFGTITTIAGTGYGAGSTAGGRYTGDNGPATAADLNGPFALTLDPAGDIYFADGYNHVVRKINTSGIITTFAGNNTPSYGGDGGTCYKRSP